MQFINSFEKSEVLIFGGIFLIVVISILFYFFSSKKKDGENKKEVKEGEESPLPIMKSLPVDENHVKKDFKIILKYDNRNTLFPISNKEKDRKKILVIEDLELKNIIEEKGLYDVTFLNDVSFFEKEEKYNLIFSPKTIENVNVVLIVSDLGEIEEDVDNIIIKPYDQETLFEQITYLIQ